MTNRFTMLPVMMIVVITFLTLFAISSGRSDDTGLVGDATYPHHICTFREYCEGEVCSEEPVSFLVYLRHENGRARLEMPRVNPTATMTQISEGREFETRGGAVTGLLTIFFGSQLEFVGASRTSEGEVEHYGTGSCEPLRNP